VVDIRGTWRRVLAAAGLANRRPRVRLHDLRGHCATEMARRGVDVKTIADLLGHASITTTAKYVRAADSEKRTAMSALVREPDLRIADAG
jgi:site-specific recombinase XerD